MGVAIRKPSDRKSGIKHVRKGLVWRHTLLVLALGRQKQVNL